MSGITPILDTLLHQVLGKRVDLPPARDLNEPVRPLTPESALQAVRSDSRLDPRPAAPGLQPRPLAADSELPPPRLSGQPGGSGAGSSQLHLSDAARSIAEVLARNPAPPSVLRPGAPLLAAPPVPMASLSIDPSPAAPTTGDPRPAVATPLAGALQASVENSGLFYESHLRRWFQGRMSPEQLQREPQQQLLASAGAEHRAPGVPEVLQGLVRQQLEMVAAPVLRWEGDAWAGLFLSLVIELPPELQQRFGRRGEDAEDASDHDEQTRTWRSELSLEVADLGLVQVRFDLQRDTLDLELISEEAAVLELLRLGCSDLQARLLGCGLSSVRLRVAGPGDEPGETQP